MFWVMLNNYQMLVMFLLLNINIDEEIQQLLESMKFSTFALNIFKIPGFEQLRDLLSDDKDTEEDEDIGNRLGLVGLEKGYFVADYIYLFTILAIVGLLHLAFFLTFRIPKVPERLVENALVTVNHFFNYSFYIRIALQ